jgi:anti-anti-sigma regulatory factor
MVFSFFKKPEKMPERQAARPRAPAPMPEVPAPKPPQVEEVVPLAEPLPDLEFTVDSISAQKSAAAPAVAAKPTTGAPAVAAKAPAVDDLDFTVDDFELSFTESSVMAIDVDHGGDPVQADVEQVVVLFANGQDAAARGLLETYIRSYPGERGKRFWNLLFDLLQVTGDRPAFDRLCVEFAEACETSPPSWREAPAAQHSSAPAGVRQLSLQGVLTAEGAQPVADLARLVEQKVAAQVDCAKLIGCDDEVAGQLATLLITARRRKLALTLTNVDAVLRRLSDRLQVGTAEHEPAWRLLLELLQRHASQEVFEERAVDYAVTFELSPPSWEALPQALAVAAELPVLDDAHYLSGELKNARFDNLAEYLAHSEAPVLDFGAVARLDFFSAGQLVNRIAPLKAAGREVVIRSPNHLVAELMAIVGLNKQARILVPKS